MHLKKPTLIWTATCLTTFCLSSEAIASEVLGALPAPGGYLSYPRIIFTVLMLLPWMAFCGWVDQDLQKVRRMNPQAWNSLVLGSGIAGLAIWLLLPWQSTGLFVAGFGLWFAITFGACSVYILLRNSWVPPEAQIFTPRQVKSWVTGVGKKRKPKMDAVERVNLTAHDGSKINVPADRTQMEAYDAAQVLLFDSMWRRATDVELLVGSSAVRLAYRIDGVVISKNDLLSREQAEQALTFIKQAAGLNIEERRRPQEGSFCGALTGAGLGMIEIEVRSSGTTQHERLSLQFVGQENRLRISDLGMTTKQQEQSEEAIQEPQGLIVVSGPRVSGLTTTLYACLRNHDAFMQNLLSLERAPLMELENITQHIYDSTKHEASYARQLQTVLRREPDVVMVSDCADRETAHLAAKAAVDGKKIYLGIQAKDSFDALKKLISLAGDLDLVAEALSVISSQRLVRKLCIACRQAYRPDRQLLKKANLPVEKIEHFFRPPPEGLMDAKGKPIVCSNCQASGYFGQTGVFELLKIDDPIRDLIRKGQPVNTIRAQARKNGMLYLQEIGLQKVIEGTTSMNEVLRALREDEGNFGSKSSRAAGKGG